MRKEIILSLFLLSIILITVNSVSAADSTDRVSLGNGGIQSDNSSLNPSITPDGRYIAYESDADNLVPQDTNNASDIFVKDGWTGENVRVSTSANGTQANGNSYNPDITSNGRYIAFESDANNLINDDTNGMRDIFVKDGWTGQIIRISTSANGTHANGNSYNPVITPDGRYIAFESDATNLVTGDTNGMRDIFVKDGWTGVITRLSISLNGTQSNGNNYRASISPNGRYFGFDSIADNLVPQDTNNASDVFIKDGWTGAITRMSTNAIGIQSNKDSFGASISPDGRYMAFESDADNLVTGDTNNLRDIFVKDGWTRQITRVSTGLNGVQSNGASYNASITPDGRYIAFESTADNLNGINGGIPQIFVKDGWRGQVIKVSVTKTGLQANGTCSKPQITSNGRYIAFQSSGSNLVDGDTNNVLDTFVKDGWYLGMVRVSTGGLEGNFDSSNISVTPNGRYVVFQSAANNLDGDNNGFIQIYVRDRWNNKTIKVSTNSNGDPANNNCYNPQINSEGRYITFESNATNLVTNDTNNIRDIFIKDGWTGQITLVSINSNGTQSNGASYNSYITANGRYITFESDATNLITGDTNGVRDIFVRDCWFGNIFRMSTTINGLQSNGASYKAFITPDGRYISFESVANNLVADDTNGLRDIFVKDGWTGSITRVSTSLNGIQSDGASYNASMTSNGRYITFESAANNLYGDNSGLIQIFVKDGWTGLIKKVSVNSSGLQANNNCSSAQITLNGRYITFQSMANNLDGDTNGFTQIFVRDLGDNSIKKISISTSGNLAQGNCSTPRITPDGVFVVFNSYASNLVPYDTNQVCDSFIHTINFSSYLGGTYYGWVEKFYYGNLISDEVVALITGVHPREYGIHNAIASAVYDKSGSLFKKYVLYIIHVTESPYDYDVGRMNGQLLAQAFVVPDVIRIRPQITIDFHENGYTASGYAYSRFIDPISTDGKTWSYVGQIISNMPFLVAYDPPSGTSPPYVTIPIANAGIPTLIYETYSSDSDARKASDANGIINTLDRIS